MALPFYALQKLRASDLLKMLSRSKVKITDEPLTSTTTLQDDDELFVSVDANVTYAVDVKLLALEASGNGADIKFAWTFPTGCILDLPVVGAHESWVASAGAALETEWAGWQNETASPTSSKTFGTHTTAFSYHMRGTLRVGSAAGTFRLQWAPKNNVVSTVTLKSGSSIELRPQLA